VNNGLFVK